MIRLAFAVVVVVVGLAACGREGRASTDQEPPPDRFPALAGAWTGGADQTPWGPARATLFVGPEGWGTVSVLVQGNVVSRRFRLLAWDGGQAELESEGRRHALAVRREGARLWIDVPGVGGVTLERDRGREPAPTGSSPPPR